MNPTEFLKANSDARLTYDDRWLVWSIVFKEWIVQQRKRYQKTTRCLYSGESLTTALKILEEGENA